MDFTIREWRKDDDVVALTSMLHRAYAPLAAAGMRYTATHQSEKVTLLRLSRGHALVAEFEGKVVGTVTVYGPKPESSVPLYRDLLTCHIGQFGVEPDWKGGGIGKALHEAALAWAVAQGARFMALDTAVPAIDLIAMYHRWGYKTVDRIRFETTNYESVIMRLDLGDQEAPRAASAAKTGAGT